jgi:alkylation response protein AidB-like acyl-CoA dehydrogenase
VTFDFTEEQRAWSQRARDFSLAVVADHARAIDEGGAIPSGVREALDTQAMTKAFANGAVAGAVVLEEIAAASAGVATALGLQWAGVALMGAQSELAGLRGSGVDAGAANRQPERVRLVLCAVAIGVGRAAVAIGVEAMKSRGIRPSGDETTPHWALADAAAELDAARLLTLSAAQIVERGEAADAALLMAARLSSAAVEGAVDAASVIEGPGGYRRGATLERLTRDARTLKLLLAEGTRQKAQGTTE